MFEMVYKDNTKEAERQRALPYYGQIVTSHIGVSLIENGNRVSWRDYGYNSETGEKVGDGNWGENTGTLLTGVVGERRKISARKNIPRRNCSIQYRSNRPILQSDYL